MAAVFTAASDATTNTPAKVLDAEVLRLTSTVVHRIVGSTEPYISLGTSELRSGKLELLYLSEAAVAAAESFFAKRSSFTVDFPERPSLEFTFVVTEAGTKRQFDRPNWRLEFEFQEVTA